MKGGALGGILGLCLLSGLVACQKTPESRIKAFRDRLAEGDEAGALARLEGLPRCTEASARPLPAEGGTPVTPGSGAVEVPCLTEIATALGSKKGYSALDPTSAAGATAAVVLLRERRGDWVPGSTAWFNTFARGTGAGLDALRLASGMSLLRVQGVLGRPTQQDAEAVAFLLAVSEATPGACPTYRMLGEGKADETLPAELQADHAPCVQKDLMRQGGRGGTYGVGLWRATAAALSLVRDEVRALREGLPLMDQEARRQLEGMLTTLDGALAKAHVKESAPRVNQGLEGLDELHGVTRDGGPPKGAVKGAAPAP